MCGIVGVVSTTPWQQQPPLSAMRDAMGHRGPDDAGEWWSPDGRVGLGHRRLSIIDLTAAGHQPMIDRTHQVAITFNGEIYNYRELRDELRSLGHEFTTQSDTEILLLGYRAWGIDLLPRLRGMFAFGLYDASRASLLLARDPAGEKPLFYYLDSGTLRFASELKALMADPDMPRRLDPLALDAYLAFGYVPGGLCLLEGVHKLEPGTFATFDLSTATFATRRYHSLPQPPDDGPVDEHALQDELEHLLYSAVKDQLAADVPVGVLLSGGIDSSLVAAMAARASATPVRTFTITFPGHRAHDEGPYARIVASHFGTRHEELVAEPATLDLLPALVRQFDEPIADSSMLPTYLVSRLIRPHCTVALGGDGGDELFGGYTLYRVVMAQQGIRRRLPGFIRGPLGASAGLLPVGFRGRTYAQAIALDQVDAVAQTGLYLDARTRARVSPLVRSAVGRLPGERHRGAAAGAVSGLIQQLTRADFHSYLPDDILVKVDRASMLTSLEVRAPFLDPRLIAFAFGRLPERLRTTAGEGKILPRRLARKLLPSSLDLNRKQGFSIPLAAWFKGEWGVRIEGVLRDAPAALLDQKAVGTLLSGQRRGFNNGQRLFALAMLALWQAEYRVEVPDLR